MYALFVVKYFIHKTFQRIELFQQLQKMYNSIFGHHEGSRLSITIETNRSILPENGELCHDELKLTCALSESVSDIAMFVDSNIQNSI